MDAINLITLLIINRQEYENWRTLITRIVPVIVHINNTDKHTCPIRYRGHHRPHNHRRTWEGSRNCKRNAVSS